MQLFVTDWDGTLFHNKISDKDINLLKQLGENNITRAVATGRNLYSAQKVIPRDFPIDYLIFSTGAGIMHWPTHELLHWSSIDSETTRTVIQYLKKIKLDFMVHCDIPDNHRFHYHRTGSVNPDFDRRLKVYEKFISPLNGWKETASQILAVICDDPLIYEQTKKHFPELNVIRTTSPLDGKSIWIEIFPKNVSKAKASSWVCNRLKIDEKKTISIGNDYNDMDMLQWSGKSYIMETAPPSLQAEFNICSSVSEVIKMAFFSCES